MSTMLLTWRKTPIQLAKLKVERWRLDRMTLEERHEYRNRQAERLLRKARARS